MCSVEFLNVSALLVLRQLGTWAYSTFVLLTTGGMTFITFNRIAIDGMAYDKTKGFFVSLGAGVSLLATAYLTLKITVFWEVAPCSLTEIYRSLLRSCCLHQGRSCAPMRGGIGISRNVGTRLPQYATSHPRGWHVRRAAQFITLLD